MFAALRSQAVILSSLLAIALTLTLFCITPPLYRGTAEFELLPQTTDYVDVARELAAIQAKANEQAEAGQRILIQLQPDSSIVEVIVFDSDPKRAAALANAVAGTYQTRRRDQETEYRAQKLEAWKMAVEVQAEREEAAHNLVLQAQQNLGNRLQTFGSEKREAWRRQHDLEVLADKQETLGRRTEKLDGLPLTDFLEEASRLKLIDSAMMQKVTEYHGTLSTLEAQQHLGSGSAHPEIEKSKNKARDLRVELETTAAEMLSELHFERKQFHTEEQDLRVQRELEWSTLQKARTDYDAAAKNREWERARLHDIQLRLEAERTSTAIIPAYVAIRKSAVQPQRPELTRLWQTLLISSLAGLGIGLLISLVRSRKARTSASRSDEYPEWALPAYRS